MTCHKVFAYHGSNTSLIYHLQRAHPIHAFLFFKLKLTIIYSVIFKKLIINSLIIDSAVDFLSELGSKIGTASGEIRERQFLFQRLSVTIQRFNAILLHNSFVDRDDQDL